MLPGDVDGTPLDLAEWTPHGVQLKDHSQFCLDALDKRKAEIVARGQPPVSIGLCTLLNRVRSSLQAEELPRGLSPRVADWAPLFHWIRLRVSDRLERLQETACTEKESFLRRNDPNFRPCGDPCSPPLDAVRLQSTEGVAPVIHRTQALLWSHDATQPVLIKPAQSMISGVSDDDDEEEGEKMTDGLQATPSTTCSAAAAVAAGVSSFSAASSSPAVAVSSLSADDESAARAAPRQRFS